MQKVFADAVYWIALINPADQWFKPTHALSASFSNYCIVTSSEVLTETLNFYAELGTAKRNAAAELIRSVLVNVDIEVIGSSQNGFIEGLALYESRQDKGYSLTDCISMNVCRNLKISEILTHDDHFSQEGFIVLL